VYASPRGLSGAVRLNRPVAQRQPGPQQCQFVAQDRRRSAECGCTQHHHDVEGRHRSSLQTEALPDQTLDAVALNSGRRLTTRDRQPKSGEASRGEAKQQGEVCRATAFRLSEDRRIGGFRQQAPLSWKASALRNRNRGSGQTGVSRTRPFARRALMILRPFFVAMRARKPWVRARLRTLG